MWAYLNTVKSHRKSPWLIHVSLHKGFWVGLYTGGGGAYIPRGGNKRGIRKMFKNKKINANEKKMEANKGQ